jgi:hypothetical protein
MPFIPALPGGAFWHILVNLRQWIVFMNFDIVDEITEIETIARGSGIREISRLRKVYGRGNRQKMKGIARVRLSSGKTRLAELQRKRYLE